ncbi:MAG TPA: hypothetical protein VHD61_15660 [Lacunisphaera sp.]|nr:hypothetical protein [Lacunisphaera sp.]
MTEPAAAAPTAEQLQQLKQVRRASLLRKWTSGAKLSLDEMAEISDLIPAEHLANPPLPKPGYRKGYEFYAIEFGYDVRNIKRWVQVGKKARKPPPLDAPAAMPQWWEELKAEGYLKMQCPPRILECAARHAPKASSAETGAVAPSARDPAAPETAIPAAPAKPDNKQQSTTKVDVERLEAIGLGAAVRELSLQLAADQKALREAREHGLDEVTINRRQKAFNSTLESLRKAEESWQKLQEARGELAPVESFRADLTVLLTTLRGMMRRRADNVAAKLAGELPAEKIELVRAAIAAEGEREFTLMRTARHWKRAPDGNIVT